MILKRNQLPIIALSLVIALGGGYVLSYAPFVWSHSDYAYGVTSIPKYRPVEWLIDDTPLQEPLFMWADVWGVCIKFVFDSDRRTAPFKLSGACFCGGANLFPTTSKGVDTP